MGVRPGGGFLPRPPGFGGPSRSTLTWTLAKASPHGERFAYKTVNTDALAWVIRQVSGQVRSANCCASALARLGAEQDAYFIVDPTGVEFAGGGLNLTLRDLARFGE